MAMPKGKALRVYASYLKLSTKLYNGPKFQTKKTAQNGESNMTHNTPRWKASYRIKLGGWRRAILPSNHYDMAIITYTNLFLLKDVLTKFTYF